MKTIDHTTEYGHPIWYGCPEHTRVWFNSVEECCQASIGPSKKCNSATSSRSDGKSYDWDLSAGWTGAVEMSKYGWPEGAAKVDDLLDTVDRVMRMKLPNQRAVLRPAIIGGRVSVPAYLAGHPRQFLALKREAATCKTIRLVYSGSTSAGVSAETMVKRGVAVCAIVQSLERRRIRVELIAAYRQQFYGDCGWPAQEGSHDLRMAVTVKRAEDKLMPDEVAYVIAHPAFYRRMIFATMEACAAKVRPGKKSAELPGYGTPMTCPIPDAYVIPTMATASDEEMQEFVEQQIEAISNKIA